MYITIPPVKAVIDRTAQQKFHENAGVTHKFIYPTNKPSYPRQMSSFCSLSLIIIILVALLINISVNVSVIYVFRQRSRACDRAMAIDDSQFSKGYSLEL